MKICIFNIFSVKFCIIILLDILSLDLKIPLSSSNFTFHYDPATCLCQDTRYNRYYFSITEKKTSKSEIETWWRENFSFTGYRTQTPVQCTGVVNLIALIESILEFKSIYQQVITMTYREKKNWAPFKLHLSPSR